MEKREENVVDKLIFEYHTYRCIGQYFDRFKDKNDDFQPKLQDKLDGLTAFFHESYLEGAEKTNSRIFLGILFRYLCCMEFSLVKSEQQVDCSFLAGERQFTDLLKQAIVFSCQNTCLEETRENARACLNETFVVFFKYCKRTDSFWREALELFSDFVKAMPTEDAKDSYNICVKTDVIDPKEDFISGYITSLRNLVKSLHDEYGQPDLIKILRHQNHEMVNSNDSENSQRSSRLCCESSNKGNAKAELEGKCETNFQTLLQDRRPTLGSDLKEFFEETGGLMSQIREKFNSFHKETHLKKLQALEKRIKKKPPSHSNFCLGAWMPEEERAFIEMTIRIGVGKWRIIKDRLKTPRSSQQLKDKWRTIKPNRIKGFEIEMKNSNQDMKECKQESC